MRRRRDLNVFGLKINVPLTMQPKAKHPLQRIPTWLALSVGIMIGLFITKMFSSVSVPPLRDSRSVCVGVFSRRAAGGPVLPRTFRCDIT